MKRAGATALSLLAAPLNVHLLQALEDGPLPLIDLRRAVGSPPQSTMRVYSRTLVEIGTLERQRQAAFPGTVEYASTESGRALLGIGQILERWLQEAPVGPITLGTTASKSATKALVEGWSTNIIRALAAKPLSLTDLNRLIPRISYPSLERRLGALRLADLVEPYPGEGRGTPYRATPWLRRAIVPLTAGAWWERRYLADPPQVGRLDVEAAFLLAIPLIELPPEVSGKCRLAVEIQGGPSPVFAGVLICVEEGKVISCSSRLEGEAEGWASGSASSWMRRMNGQEGDLEIGGDADLVREIVEAIRKSALAVKL
ncbi:MAG TPA: winged helix-turn-helix transcriptional regulator [Solirubrobacterales bacterium]|nr:winged helix-turn-helix transcriptional regulator [Solirubrobacterales bacterium]